MFWSALHQMESQDNYADELLASHRKRPSEMSNAMLIRMRNSGEEAICGVPIDHLIGPKA